MLLITFKILHGLSRKYLSDLINIQQPLFYNLRRNDNGRLLEKPTTKKKNNGRQSFPGSCSFPMEKAAKVRARSNELRIFQYLN